jgi:hypothetical protein
MARFALLLPALGLVALAADGLYQASRGRQEITIPCQQFASGNPSSRLVRVTGCEIDFAGVAYRESLGRIAELYFPARSAAGGDALVVAVTSNPAALAVVQRLLGSGRQPAPEVSIPAMQKAAAAAGASPDIRGLVRAGVFQSFTSRRVLSGIAVPLAESVAIVDLQAAPDFITPLIELLAGLALAAAAFLFLNRSPAPASPPVESSDREEILERLRRHTEAMHAPAEPAEPRPTPSSPARANERAIDMSQRVEPLTPAPKPIPPPGAGRETETIQEATTPERPAIRLPAVMLLNVSETAGPSDIESAPPLGSRDDVLEQLREVLPDLEVDARGRGQHQGPAHEVRVDLGASDPVHTLVLEASGETGSSLVRWIMEATGWRAFVPKRGCFVEADALETVALRADE